jgi:predicted HTH transcriptional regulator
VFFPTYGANLATGSRDQSLLATREETVTALLNTDGGTIVIGVDEHRKVLGLRADLNLIEPHTREALRSAMMEHLRRALGPVVDTLVRPEFVEASGSEMCIIHVGGAEKPVFVKRAGSRKYYRRENGINVGFEPSRRPIKLPKRRRQ